MTMVSAVPSAPSALFIHSSPRPSWSRYLWCTAVATLLLASGLHAQPTDEKTLTTTAATTTVSGTCPNGGSTQEDGTCGASLQSQDTAKRSTTCDVPLAACQAPTSLYDSGTAVAYTSPDRRRLVDDSAAAAVTICDPVHTPRTHRVANWPFYRSTRADPASNVSVTLNLYSCPPSNNNKNDPSCCCAPLASSFSSPTRVDIWQARPDGTYSSLRSHGNCRASVATTNTALSFETVAPGSVGSLGGLGRQRSSFFGGTDLPPYGEPVLHVMVRAQGHAPVLVDVPTAAAEVILRGSAVSDWRGAAWVRPKEDGRFRVVQQQGVGENKDSDASTIQLSIDVFLTPSMDSSDGDEYTTENEEDSKTLCEASIYGLPSSFFHEPMAVCAPSLLAFFDL